MKQILFLKNIWRGVNDRGKKLSFESNSYLEFHLSCEGDLGEGEAGGWQVRDTAGAQYVLHACMSLFLEYGP